MTMPKLVLPKNHLSQELKNYEGFPNKSREQRSLIKKSNPLHYTFGNVRPVWKTWLTYMENMELIHGGQYEDEGNQTLQKAEQA